MGGNDMVSQRLALRAEPPALGAVRRGGVGWLAGTVEGRLVAWGREFGFRAGASGYASVSPLWTFLRFGGVSPRGTGSPPPLHIDAAALEIERIVATMFATAPVEASVLRAYYGGVGRQKVERRALAERLAGVRIGARDYFHARERGAAWVMGALA